MTIYRYKLKEIAAPYFFSICWLGICIVLPTILLKTILVTQPQMVKGSIWDVGPFLIGALLTGPGGLALIYFYFRPVGISDEIIQNFAFGRPSQTIPWNEVTKIERTRKFDNSTWTKRTIFTIHSPRRRMSFDDRLDKLNYLIEKINDQVTKRNIPIIDIEIARSIRREVPILALIDIATGNYSEGVKTSANEL